MEIGEIQKVLEAGDVEKALHEISILESGILATDLSIQVQLLKADALIKMSQFENAINLSHQIIQSADKLKMTLEKIDALLHLSHANYRLGNNNESLKILEKVQHEISNIEGYSTEEIAKREAKLINAKGTVYTELGESTKAIECYQQSYEINKIIDDKRGMAVAFNNIGSIHSSRGNYDDALDKYRQSVDIADEINDLQVASVGLFNMAGLYQVKGELDTSLKYLERSMEVNKKFGYRMGEAYCLVAMGNVYEDKGKINMAIDSYHKSLDYFQEIGHGLLQSSTHLSLIVSYITIREINEAKQHLDQMLSLKQEDNNPTIDLEYKFGEGIILKTSKRFTKRALAQTKFKEIVENKDVNLELASQAFLYLFESLFSELYESGDESILEDIEYYLDKFERNVKKLNSYTMLIESYFIRSKIELINLNVDEVKNLLIQSQILAEEKGLDRLSQRVSIEYDNLVKQLEEWDNLLNEKSTIPQRMRLAEMDKYVPEMLKKTIELNPEKIQDTPILLIIMRSGGITLFSKNFDKESRDDFLIGSFLSAINSFISKAFSTTGIIDIIRIQDYSLIMISPFVLENSDEQHITFAYMFKGYSYSARQRLNSFIEELRFKPIWDILISKNYGLSSHDESILDNIINKIFIS